MLKQLGNLHEAGRELAEARERAAKAETEADFLRERVADLRERLDTAERMATEPPSASEVPSETAGSPSPLPALHPLAVARTVYGGWRSRLGRWIEPSSSGP